MNYIAESLILIFLIVTFLQSGLDKAMDWKGNVSWLKAHFAGTFLANKIPFCLGVILLLEILAVIFSVLGIYELLLGNTGQMAVVAGVVSAITLLLLLYGQRVAKDYDGARTIVIYFIPVVFLIYIL